MTRQDDQYPRYVAPKDYDARFEDHPFPRKRRWLIPCLLATLCLVLVIALVSAGKGF